MRVFGLKADVENYRTFRFASTAGIDWMLSLRSAASVAAGYDPFSIEPIEDDLSVGKPYGDFPYVGGVPAFSARAVHVLLDLLVENGEILPLTSNVGEYYAFHVTRSVDALDVDASDVVRFSAGPIMDVRRWAFRPERVQGLSIFQVPELPTTVDVFVTDVFQQRIQEAGLKGLLLPLLWQTQDIPNRVA